MADAEDPTEVGRWQAGAVLGVWLIAIFLLGQLSALTQIASRCVFPYGNLVVRESVSQWRSLFAPPIGMFLDLLQWSLLGAVFARAARSVRLPYVVLLGFVTICFVAVSTMIAASFFSVEIDAGFLSNVKPAR